MKLVRIALPLAALSAAAPSFAQSPPAPPAPVVAQPAAPAPAGSAAPAAPLGPTGERVNQAEERARKIRPQPGGWTSDSVAKRARSTSPDVQAKHEAIAAAAAKVDQAVVSYVPRITGTGRYTRLSYVAGLTSPLFSIPAAPQDQWLFQGSVTVPVSDYFLRISQAHTAATHNEEAARLDKLAAEAKAAADARLAFYQWVKAGGQREVLSLSLQATEEHKKDADNLFKAGQASKADVLSVEAAVAQGKLALDQADELFKLSEAQVRLLAHAPEEEPAYLGEDVTITSPPTPVDIPALKQEAIDNRPELRSLMLGEEALNKSATAIRAGQYPRLDAFGDLVHANPNQRVFPTVAEFKTTWDVGLQVTWSPNDTFTYRGSAAEAQANAAKLRALRAQARDGILLEVSQAALAMKTADASVETSMIGVQAAEEAYRVRRELFRVGRATSVELTDAETNLLRARLIAVNARIDQRIAKVRLEHAVGRDAKRLRKPRVQVWVGTMGFGKRTPEPEARRIVAQALERGVRAFDTANVYGDGVAERILGAALAKVDRASVRVCTKAGLGRPAAGGRGPEGLSEGAIVSALTASVARLGTGHVDLFLLHKPDPETPIEATLDGVARVLELGLARAWGVSNFAAWQMLDLSHAARARGLPEPRFAQQLYNLVHRELDVEMLPYARAHGVDVVAYNPLAGGLLSGAYTGEAPAMPAGQRLAKNPMYAARYGSDVLRARASGYAALAKEHGLSLLALAYGFLASRAAAGALAGVAIGPGTLAHLTSGLDALAAPLAPEALAAVEAQHAADLGTDTHYVR